MPIYTYRREDGSRFDYRQSFHEQPLAHCPQTGQRVIRVVQPVGIVFKGSGFYVNDSRAAKSAANAAGSGAKTASGENGKAGDAGENGAQPQKDQAATAAKEATNETKSEKQAAPAKAD